jgi:hypothetical protein
MSTLVFMQRLSWKHIKSSIFLITGIKAPVELQNLQYCICNIYSLQGQALLQLMCSYYSTYSRMQLLGEEEYWWWPKKLPWYTPLRGRMPTNVQCIIEANLSYEDEPIYVLDDEDRDPLPYDPPPQQEITSLWPLFEDSTSCVSLLQERSLCHRISDLAIRRMVLYITNRKFEESDVLLLEEDHMLHPLALKAFNYLWAHPCITHRSRAFIQVCYFASNVTLINHTCACCLDFSDERCTNVHMFRREMARSKKHWRLPIMVTQHLDASHLCGVEKILHVKF